MALDALVDSTALDTALTATANAIRTKGGTSAQIAWDAVDGFKDAIDAIQTGGGLPSGLNAIAYGTYTPAEDITTTQRIVITHNLGITPFGCIMFPTPNGRDESPVYSALDLFHSLIFAYNITANLYHAYIPSWASNWDFRNKNTGYLVNRGGFTYDTNNERGITNITDTTFDFVTNANYSALLEAVTYIWIVWG